MRNKTNCTVNTRFLLRFGPVRTTRNFVCFAKNLSTRNHFKCERFFSSTKILSSVTKLERDRRVALEAYIFLSSEKIYCSVTATLQRVIIFRNRYHTKWYCVRDPIYLHLEMNRRGEMSDRDSDPAPFVRNSYIPETQQYLNYYGSQCYYEEPQALPQYYCFPQSQPQGQFVEGEPRPFGK